MSGLSFQLKYPEAKSLPFAIGLTSSFTTFWYCDYHILIHQDYGSVSPMAGLNA